MSLSLLQFVLLIMFFLVLFQHKYIMKSFKELVSKFLKNLDKTNSNKTKFKN